MQHELTWVTVAALRSLALNMIYFQGIKHEFAVTIGLGILALSTVIWFILENTLLKEHLQYTITIYPVLIWVMAASVPCQPHQYRYHGSSCIDVMHVFLSKDPSPNLERYSK